MRFALGSCAAVEEPGLAGGNWVTQSQCPPRHGALVVPALNSLVGFRPLAVGELRRLFKRKPLPLSHSIDLKVRLRCERPRLFPEAGPKD